MPLPRPSLPTPRRTFGAGAGLLVAALTLAPAAAGRARPAAVADPMQVLADVVLIESRCRDLNVDNGRAYAYARRNGIDPDDILPAGPRRPAFEAAFRRRERAVDDAELCGALAAAREVDIPGVFVSR